jgi:glutamyl-tRNA reductase
LSGNQIAESDYNTSLIKKKFDNLMVQMRSRDVKKNISKIKENVASLQTNTNEFAQKAKQGHFNLKNKRENCPVEYQNIG